jgi:hypothetical protein
LSTLAPLLVTWYDDRVASAACPLRFTAPPGPALLRQNLSWFRIETNLGAIDCERLLAQRPAQLLALFELRALPRALSACRRLAQGGLAIVALRGRLVPRPDLECFSDVSLAPSLVAHLQALNCPLPARWQHPILGVEVYHPEYRRVRFGAVFSRTPEPGVLDFADIGQDGQREGAPPSGLPQATTLDDLPRLCRALERAGLTSLLLVDNGGDPEPLAQRLLELGRLGAWFGPARRPVPDLVRANHVPAYTWFEPEDFADDLSVKAARVPLGCAFLPVGMPREDAAQATERVLAVRELGYGAIVPRFFTPIPNTSEWAQCLTTAGLRSRSLADLDGSTPVFETSGYGSAGASQWRLLWTRDNRWPEPPRDAAVAAQRTRSFANLRRALDEYLADAQVRPPQCQTRDAFETLMAAVDSPAELARLDAYPFVAWQGQSLLHTVDQALSARLAALHEMPAAVAQLLVQRCQDGGRRIHPLMLLIMTCARGVPLSASLPAALATEWLQLASRLRQDPPADEALGSLAVEALTAMSLADLEALADHAAIGPERAAQLVQDLRHELGVARVSVHDTFASWRETAGPLFRLTARLAATLGATPEPLATQLIELLPSLGLAFQLADEALVQRASAQDSPGRAGEPGAGSGDVSVLLGARAGGVGGKREDGPRPRAAWSDLQRSHPELFALSRLAQFVSEKER